MNYHWNTIELMKRKHNLIKLQKNSLLLKSTKQLIHYDLISYHNLLTDNHAILRHLSTLCRNIQGSKNQQQSSQKVKKEQIAPTTIQKLLNCIYITNEIPITQEEEILQFISTDEMFNLLEDAYKKMGQYYNQFFKKYKDNQSLLSIEQNRPKQCQYRGYMQKIYTTNTGYIKLYQTNTIQDVITCGHEIFHAINSQHTTFQQEKRKNKYLEETDGFFFNLWILEYLKNTPYKKDAKRIEIDEKEAIIECIETLYCQYYLQKYLRYSNSLDTAIQKINEDFGKKEILLTLEKGMIPFIQEDSPIVLIQQIISYLIALELLERYKQDAEKTLDEIMKICNSKDCVEKTLEKYQISFLEDDFKQFKKNLL